MCLIRIGIQWTANIRPTPCPPLPSPAVNVHPVHARREGEDPGALQLHPSSATRSTLITATAARGPASEGWAMAWLGRGLGVSSPAWRGKASRGHWPATPRGPPRSSRLEPARPVSRPSQCIASPRRGGLRLAAPGKASLR